MNWLKEYFDILIKKDFCLNYLSCLKKVASQLNVTYSQAICINYIPSRGISQADLAKKLSIDKDFEANYDSGNKLLKKYKGSLWN